jgi:hypothetical protein
LRALVISDTHFAWTGRDLLREGSLLAGGPGLPKAPA